MACTTGAFFIGNIGTNRRLERATSICAQARLCGTPRSIAYRAPMRPAGTFTTNGMVRPAPLWGTLAIPLVQEAIMRTKPVGATVYRIDLSKNTFHVVGTDSCGCLLQRATLGRATVFRFFANAPAALIGMEACPGSQWLAWKLEFLGHTVRIIPAQFVKPYLKSNKNDLLDAAAIAEAVTRPGMRFVTAKSTEQAELQTMHRISDRLVGSKTQLINQIRAFCFAC